MFQNGIIKILKSMQGKKIKKALISESLDFSTTFYYLSVARTRFELVSALGGYESMDQIF
jgi:hypothetical protein